MRLLQSKAFWLLLFVSGFVPLLTLVATGIWGDLGVEPAKYVVEYLGESALIVLLLTLSLTPLRKLSYFKGVARYRRMLGLFALFYAALHLFTYGFLLVDWYNFLEDLYKRPYVIAGALAFLILLVLGVTSPKAMVKRLGGRWKSLHRMVYLALFLVLVHVCWQVRSDYFEFAVYSLVAAILMSFRFSYFKSLVLRSN